MTDWPVLYTEGRTERDRLASTHRPIPLPAYDVDGNLIDPSNCKQELAGAIVRISFTLSHWLIKSDSANSKDTAPPSSSAQPHASTSSNKYSFHFCSFHFYSCLPLAYIHRSSSHMKNTFAADVKSIRVLVKPPPVSPNKRQTSQRDPDDFLSPKKINLGRKKF